MISSVGGGARRLSGSPNLCLGIRPITGPISLLSLSKVESSEYMVRARTPGPKQRVCLYRLQQSIILPQCLLIGLELMQTLLSLLNITFGLIGRLKILLLSPSRCPNSNLFILIILTTIAYQSSPLTLIYIILLSYLVSSL